MQKLLPNDAKVSVEVYAKLQPKPKQLVQPKYLEQEPKRKTLI